MSASSLNAFSVQFDRYVPVVVFVFGFIGNILIILTFTRPRLIKNPCSLYFLCSSIANLFELFFGLVARSLSDGFGIDPESKNLGFCRFRYFILHSSLVLSSWFIILAGIDRYCISSRHVHRRRLSNLKYARYLVALTPLIVLAMYSHALVLFTIQQLPTGPYCYARDGAYRIFYDFFYFATFSFTPPILMIIVGLGTFYNIHQMRRQILPTTGNNINVYQLRKRDRQMIRMLLVQFIFTITLTLPIAIQKLYATFTQNVVKDAYRLAAENFVATLLRIFTHINCSAGFYIFLVSGSGFRYELGQMIVNFIGYIFGVNSRFYGRVQNFTVTAPTVRVATMNKTASTLNNH